MKRVLFLMAAAIMAVTLVACGAPATQQMDAATSAPATEAASAPVSPARKSRLAVTRAESGCAPRHRTHSRRAHSTSSWHFCLLFSVYRIS